jgi:hypothetical protein
MGNWFISLVAQRGQSDMSPTSRIRRRFVLISLLLAIGAGVGGSAIGTFYYRVIVSNDVKTRIKEWSQKRGGHVSIDLVDGGLTINTGPHRLSEGEARELIALWQRCYDDILIPCDIYLEVSNGLDVTTAKVLCDDQLVGLKAIDADFNDVTLEYIASHAHRLRNASFDGTNISDRGLTSLVPSRLESLSLCRTKVTTSGICALSHSATLLTLDIRNTKVDAVTIKKCLPSVTVIH